MPAIGIRGELTTSLFLPDGTFVYSETRDNHITNAGIRAVSRLVCGVEPKTFGYIQIGTGGEEYQQLTDPETGRGVTYLNGDPVMGGVFKIISDADTTLFTYYAETNNVSKVLSNYGAYTMSANFQVLLDDVVNEAGIFSDSITGSPVMLAKQVFSNTKKMWRSRQDSTLSIITGTYIILGITWKIFFSRDPQYEALYDPDLITVGEV